MNFERYEIDGSRVVYEFLIMRIEWEMDNYGWVTEDKRLFSTSHGGDPYEMSIDELNSYIEDTEVCLQNLKIAKLAVT